MALTLEALQKKIEDGVIAAYLQKHGNDRNFNPQNSLDDLIRFCVTDPVGEIKLAVKVQIYNCNGRGIQRSYCSPEQRLLRWLRALTRLNVTAETIAYAIELGERVIEDTFENEKLHLHVRYSKINEEAESYAD